jgi:hypothetical protein
MDVSVEKHILKNLGVLIRQSSTRYANEFVWQDVKLTDEFKNTYSRYLDKSDYGIEFFDSTAVITTSLNKYIFVPNQWFVIASYAVDVYGELYRYKNYFKDIATDVAQRPDSYAKNLRDSPSVADKKVFIDSAKYVMSKSYKTPEKIEDAANKLWRFVTDYFWWSGQKTIDRGDFYISVILNMLNLVNVSQGYVADIVFAYGTDHSLYSLVKSVDMFTVDLACNIITGDPSGSEKIYSLNMESELASVAENQNESNQPSNARIKISKSRLKEIKYHG